MASQASNPQGAEKVALLTRPTLARQDAPFPMLRSRLESILNGDPAASLTRRRAQTWCSLFVAPCAPEATSPVLPSAAALPAERRVSARRGWAGENRGFFEHPAKMSNEQRFTSYVPESVPFLLTSGNIVPQD